MKFNKLLKAVMPRRKVKHSVRVAKRLKNTPTEVQYAALFHDYKERGGDIEILKSVLDPSTIHLIELMSVKGKQSITEYMEQTLNSITDSNLKNFLILIKLADRKDNFNKREKTRKLTPKYRKKTRELIRVLIHNYTGDKHLLNDALQ